MDHLPHPIIQHADLRAALVVEAAYPTEAAAELLQDMHLNVADAGLGHVAGVHHEAEATQVAHAIMGDVQGDRPGFTDFVGRAKYDAWVDLKGQSLEQAKQTYVDLIESLNK